MWVRCALPTIVKTSAVLAFLFFLLLGAGHAAATPHTPVAAPTGSPNASLHSHTSPPAMGTAYGVRTMYNSSRLPHTTGGTGITVAVLDTGVDKTHPDLRDRIADCRDYTGNDVTHGACTDENGHGTHVAGIVLADGGPNGTGIYGVAPDAKLYAYKICTDQGSCRSGDLRDALTDAVDAGAEIIVVSLGGKSTPHVQGAIRYAEQNGVLVIAAAGNGGPGLDTIEYPAADGRVIGVGAVEWAHPDRGIDPAAFRATDFSSRGANATEFQPANGYLELTAPGAAVHSTWPNSEYSTRSGTSMAAPHIAGIAAKFWTRVNDTAGDGKADDVRRVLRDRAQRFDITAGRYARQGYDPAAGLGIPMIEPPRPRFTVAPAIPTAGTRVTLNATRSRSVDSPIVSYTWDLDGDGTVDATGGHLNHTFRSPGAHRVTLHIETKDGMTATTHDIVQVNAPPTAVFTLSAEVPLQHDPVEFDAAQSVDPDGAIERYEWDFNHDGVIDARGTRLSHAFSTYGIHEITLAVTDDVGATATTNRSILVNDPPNVTIDGPTTVRPGQRVTLTAAVDNEIGSITVTWEFDDGTTASGSTITGSFDAGRHQVTVQVEDEYGATATRTINLSVRTPARTETPAQPGFTAGSVAVALLVLVVLLRRRR